MDKETLSLLVDSIQRWAKDNSTLFANLEKDCVHLNKLYQELHALGVLRLLGEEETHHDLEAVAALAYELAQYSASVAVMLVQQNMAHWLLAEAKLRAPLHGWLALPIFEAPCEWPWQTKWQDIPLINYAPLLLLPVASAKSSEFKFVLLPLTSKSSNADVQKLGLRAMPQADFLTGLNPVKAEQIVAQGADFLQKINSLWSQMEVCFIAVRAGIAKASYDSALAYAKERYQGGKIIIEHSLIQKMLADMWREQQQMDGAWRMLASTLTPYQPLTQGQMAMALNSGEKLPYLCSDGIQIFGGIGYMEDFPQERRYRDAKQCEFLLGHPQARNFALWQQAM